MIFTESTIKISNNSAKMDSTIVLYRGDKNVEIRFTILQSPFKYSNTVATNIIESTNASYGQLVIKTPNDKPPIFSEVSATKEGTILFTITKEMIDEIEEVGVYTFQIRLMDENKQSRVTIPPVENGIEIKEPIAIEDDNTTNVVGLAKANYAVATLSDVDTPTFDDNGKYNKTNWNDGDIITNASLNKIEDGIYTTNENVTATKKYVDDEIYSKGLKEYIGTKENPVLFTEIKGGWSIVKNYYKWYAEYENPIPCGNMLVHKFPFGKNFYITYMNGAELTRYGYNTTTHVTKGYSHVLNNEVLTTYNTQEYTPTTDYHPATKKYVDDNKIAYTISSKVLTTVPASSIKLDESITVNNVSINGDRRYYIEFLGSKKLCSLSIDEEIGNATTCSINNYAIEVLNDSSNISMSVSKINTNDTTTDTFTDLVIYEEEVKYLDNKYLETDLVLQNSISLGRIGDIGTGSSAIGYDVEASGNFSHAEGNGTKASGNYGSHAEGDNTESSGESSHAEGVNTIASGSHSHAEGNNTKASGMSSHTEGDSTTASGDYSHAEGSGTTASGYASHAEGSTTTASGVNSHAEGDYTTASGTSSHAEGYGSKASSQFQHVQGKYNIEDKDRKYAHIVGNGAGDAKRSNAHTLDWKGNGWYAGKLSQEGIPIEDKDLATKKYVDDKVTSLPQLSFNEAGELVVTINGVSKTFIPKNV